MEDGSRGHLDAIDCVDQLKAALIKQREVASRLAFDLSTRYLAAIEGLALDPSTSGIRYTALDPYSGKPVEVENKQVAGIFSSILRKFNELGDWSPLRDAELRTELLGILARNQISALEAARAEVKDPEVAEIVRKAIEQATQLGVRPRDPDHS